MSIVLMGPYLGSFEQEITTFLPYVRWVKALVDDSDVVYINTHSNRSFLYRDMVDRDHFISIFHNLSREEINQVGVIHESVNQKDYSIILKGIKDYISDVESCNKKDIVHKSISYTKNAIHVPIYTKMFDEYDFKYEIDRRYKNRIWFIPSIHGDKETLKLIRNEFNLPILGDRKTHFKEENELLKRFDYFEIGYKFIVRSIMEAKAIICPISHWTLIANIHGVPVFSWGEYVSQFKEGGIYYFDNKESYIYPYTEESNPKHLINSIKYFMRSL